MDRQIQILHTIFQLELAPPLNFGEEWNSNTSFYFIYTKFSKHIGSYNTKTKVCSFHTDVVSRPIQQKIKQSFNVDTISDEEMYHIAKHLFNWLKNKFPKEVKTVKIRNYDTSRLVFYPYEIDD